MGDKELIDRQKLTWEGRWLSVDTGSHPIAQFHRTIRIMTIIDKII